MKRRALFSSDSDASDDDILPRRATRMSSQHGFDAHFTDPLQASFADPAAPASSPSAEGGAPPSHSAPVAEALPQTSKAAYTRHNLSQLFGGGLAVPTFPSGAASALPDTAAAAGSESSGGLTASRGVETLFAPRFTYEDPNASNSTALKGGVTGLATAVHAVVQAYRGELSCGTAMLALCVPSAPTPPTASSSASQQMPPSAAARERLQHQQRQDVSGSSSPAPSSASAVPLLLLMSANRQVLCRVPLNDVDAVNGSSSSSSGGGALQLQQDGAQPQYLTFFAAPPGSSRSSSGSGSAACWWTCMFPDRDKASEFLVSVYTVAQYAAALAKRAGVTSASVPTVRVVSRAGGSPDSEYAIDEDRDSESRCVRIGTAARVHWTTWTLRRLSRTTPYCLPADRVDYVPPSSPREVTPGAGAAREGLEAALVGMRSGEARVVFLSAEETRVRRPELATPPQQLSSSSRRRRSHNGTATAATAELDGPVVVYVTCVEAVTKVAAAASLPLTTVAPPSQPQPQQQQQQHEAAVADPATATTGALLQQLLLQTLQQPPPSTTTASSSPPQRPGWSDAVERSLDRVMLQLGSLYEKVDRLDIDGKLQRNNAEIERAMKRVVGLSPQEDVAMEDTVKDRDALLATLERYRERYEEANTNYQRALEAMGRSSDRAQALERDLQVQQELWSRQRTDEAERARLRAVERDLRHREEMERVSEQRYAAGKSDGHAAGYKEGRQAALSALDGEGGVSAVLVEWRAKVTARDQQIVALQTALQDAKFHHERDRRQLRAEIDVLTELHEKLMHVQANSDIRMPEETTQHQCKRVKRTLNTVYAAVEAQVLTLPQYSSDSISTHDGGADRLVSAQDVLAVVMSVIKNEAQAAVAQIRSEGERRTRENAEVRALTLARPTTQRLTAAYMNRDADGHEEQADVRGDRESTTAPPPPPPLPTAGSCGALAAVAASLLPAVVEATTTTAAYSASLSDGPSAPHECAGDEARATDATASIVTLSSEPHRVPESGSAYNAVSEDEAAVADFPADTTESPPSSHTGGCPATRLPASPPSPPPQQEGAAPLPVSPRPPSTREAIDDFFEEFERRSTTKSATSGDAAAGAGASRSALSGGAAGDNEATPSVPDWEGRRLFTTPPSFTKPVQEQH